MRFKRRGLRLDSGAIKINGSVIHIGGSFEDIAAKINQARIDVSAKIAVNSEGDRRLVLVSHQETIEIQDSQKLLSELVKNNMVGSTEDKLIQVIGANTDIPSVTIIYFDIIESNIVNHLSLLSDSNITQIARIVSRPEPVEGAAYKDVQTTKHAINLNI